MCPPLPLETGQIKLVSGVICFPTLWEDFSRFLFFLPFLGCGCGRIVKPHAAERQAGLLFNTMEESQMNSTELHLGIGHYCESSVTAQSLRSFGAFGDHEPQLQSVAWHPTATENNLLRLDALLFLAVLTIHPSCCCCSCFDLKCWFVLYSPRSWPLLQVGALVLSPACIGRLHLAPAR